MRSSQQGEAATSSQKQKENTKTPFFLNWSNQLLCIEHILGWLGDAWLEKQNSKEGTINNLQFCDSYCYYFQPVVENRLEQQSKWWPTWSWWIWCWQDERRVGWWHAASLLVDWYSTLASTTTPWSGRRWGNAMRGYIQTASLATGEAPPHPPTKMREPQSVSAQKDTG